MLKAVFFYCGFFLLLRLSKFNLTQKGSHLNFYFIDLINATKDICRKVIEVFGSASSDDNKR